MAVEAPQSPGSIQPMARSWRRIAIGVVVVFVAVVVAIALTLETVYMPLVEGSSVGPDSSTPNSLFVQSISSPMDPGALFTYCFKPGAAYAWLISLANPGPLPVTILGSGQAGPAGFFIPVDFALVDGPSGSPLTDAQAAPVLPPTILDPGAEINLWARYRMGDGPIGAGGITWTQNVAVRYSVLGLERTATVVFRDGLGIVGPPCTNAPNADAP